MGARDISLLRRNQGLLHEFNPLALIKFLSNVSIQLSIQFSSGTVHVVGKWTPPLSTLSVSLSLRDRHLGLNRPLTSLRFGTHYRGIFNRGLDGARTPLACHTRPNKKHCSLSPRYPVTALSISPLTRRADRVHRPDIIFAAVQPIVVRFPLKKVSIQPVRPSRIPRAHVSMEGRHRYFWAHAFSSPSTHTRAAIRYNVFSPALKPVLSRTVTVRNVSRQDLQDIFPSFFPFFFLYGGTSRRLPQSKRFDAGLTRV